MSRNQQKGKGRRVAGNNLRRAKRCKIGEKLTNREMWLLSKGSNVEYR